MSKGTSFFAFVAGIATGVPLTMLTFTETGQRLIETVEKKGEQLIKDIKEDIDEDIDEVENED